MTSVVRGAGNTVKAAFRGGFDRLMNIEGAETKLRTLALASQEAAGLSGRALEEFADNQVAAAMSTVNNAVDGTKFAISDAADMASILGLAGVDAGKDMERWLTVTADAAQFSNKSFGEMQDVIQRVAQDGRVTGVTLNRFPMAVAALADHLGVSQEEVRKLASQGQISAEQFREALENKIGGAAKNAGEDFRSLAANIATAMNASMANLLKPVVEGLKPVMAAGLDVLKLFRDNVAKPLGESLGVWLQPRAEALAAAIGKLPETFANLRAQAEPVLSFIRDALTGATGAGGQLGDILGSIREWLSTIVGVAGDLFTGFLDGFGGVEGVLNTVKDLLPLLLGPLGLVRDALMEVFSSGAVDVAEFGEMVGSTLGPILSLLGELAGIVSGVLAEALATIIPIAMELAGTLLSVAGALIEQLVPVIGDLITGLLPPLIEAFMTFVPVVLSLVESLYPLISQLVEMLAPILMDLINAILPPLISLFDTLVPAVMDVIAAIMPLVEVLLNQLIPPILEIVGAVVPPLIGIFLEVVNLISAVVVPILVMLAEVFTQTLMPVIEALLPVVTTVFETVANIIGSIMTVIQGVIRTVTGIIKGDWSQAWSGIKLIFSGVWNGIKSILMGAVNILKSLVSGLWNGIKSLFSNGVKNAISIVKTIPGGIGRALSGLMKMGLDAGGKLLQGLTDGIKNMLGKPVEMVKNGLSKIRNLLPFSPAKEGPFSGKGYTSHSGKALIRDLAKGIEDEQDTLYDTMDDVLGGADTDLTGTNSVNARGRAGSIQVAGPLVQVERMEVRDESDIRRISRELQKLIDDRLRSLGRPVVGVV